MSQLSDISLVAQVIVFHNTKAFDQLVKKYHPDRYTDPDLKAVANEKLVEINDKPMTIIYPGALVGNAPEADSLPPADPYKLAYNVVAEDRSVGIRIPLMKFCVELVRRFGRPVVSTSANISGEPSPRNFKEISQVIKDSADYIVDQSLEKGSTGRPSSIIKVELDSTVKIIR